MKILITEKHLKSILDDPNILSEQELATDNNAELIVLQNLINDKLNKSQKDILDKTTIKVTGNASNVQLQIGGQTYPMNSMTKGIYAIIVPPSKTLSFGQIPLTQLVPEIEKMKEFQDLSQKHPEIKNQIQQGTVNAILYTDRQNQGEFKFTVRSSPESKEDRKLAVPYGSEYPLGEFLERNKLIYVFKNGIYGILESGSLYVDLAGFKLELDTPKTNVPKQPIVIKTIQLQDLFNYNGVDFKNEAQTNQQIFSFVQQVKSLIQKYGETFINHIKRQNPTVLGYSSVDGDPNQKIIGEYKPCSGAGTRKNYDLCLSQARSKVIADMLNKELPELGNAFKFKGMGETTQWGPGWTAQSPTIPEQTAPNRRYILSQIQPFTAPQGTTGTQGTVGTAGAPTAPVVPTALPKL